jgi:hypothetical protein
MKHGKYTVKELLANSNLEQILIPEIQRDYVWGKENVRALLKSIEDDAKIESKKTAGIDEKLLNSLTPEQKEIIQRSLEENKTFSNIGFIYAYVDGELIDRYFLIDGQQRITTIYLLLLAVSIKDGKQLFFRKTYFNHDLPKVDYKVREAAHEFLKEFITFLLEGGKVKDVIDQCWYFDVYENDKTIQSILRNYKVIEEFVLQSKIDLDYTENNIELWYFNTTESEQGEDLYIYMNSRGEAVQSNENIKAQLLEGLPEKQKHDWGTEWETWQNFFWQKKGDKNRNADKGFNEFLKWVKIIEFVKSGKSKNRKEQADFIRELKIAEKISTEYLTLDLVKQNYEALLRLESETGYKYLKREWLAADIVFIDYIKLLPVLMYVSKHGNASLEEINRYARYFFNIVKDEVISKNSPEYTAHAISLTNDFLLGGHTDVADMIKLSNKDAYKIILPSEEIFKLSLYKQPLKPYLREDYEKAFWGIEDFNLCNGRIQFILYSMGFDLLTIPIKDFNLKIFNTYSQHFVSLFRYPDDILRRTLLSIGDYSFKDGDSTNLEMPRYNFGDNMENWKTILNLESGKKVVKKLLDYFKEHDNPLMEKEYHSIFDTIRAKYLEQYSPESWRYYFISDPAVFAYCWGKRACIDADNIYLIQNIKATTYLPIEDLV